MFVRRAALAFVIVLLVCSVGVGHAAGAPNGTTPKHEDSNATLVSAYPSPVAREDPGEFVTVRFPDPTNTTGWTLTDGKTTARLPNRTVEGTVAFAMDPSAARRHTDHAVAPLGGRLLLANGGDRLVLRAGNRTIDSAQYRDAPESRVRDFEAGRWRPVGATTFEPVRTAGGTATAFVLPDGDNVTVETLAAADERLLLAGYTLTSARVTDALVEAHENGAAVRVLLDGSPVGGMTVRQQRQLDRLTEAGVSVRLLSGPHTCYEHHHPKYAVVDDRALVLTENFKPAGTGGMSSRGWGVILDNGEAAASLADLHGADWRWRAATPWEEYRAGRDFAEANPALGEFESRHPPEELPVDSATVLVAPDNAADGMVDRIDTADERVLVQQMRIDGRNERLLRAVLRAADRGVTVRIHLSGAWYAEEDNAALVSWLNRRAKAEGWDLQARVDEARGYEKIHTKGVVVDETVLLGSLNWGPTARTENREVVVALEGEAVAAYYADVFEEDWSKPDATDRPLPAGLLGAVAVAGAGGLLVARKITFVGRDSVVTDWEW
ncbi:phospholipase [Natronomonas halophila]|uniref:phospholipase D-like domain-containing protein n=1 Tax=Natronomonas halophila TaxID=2747817 RepID=UPI0015B3F212|nr:phospholipase D-like domain-containing protein [Natronomonas halophila]QLD85066.1 phospholipase [Natronomonas halophila]